MYFSVSVEPYDLVKRRKCSILLPTKFALSLAKNDVYRDCLNSLPWESRFYGKKNVYTSCRNFIPGRPSFLLVKIAFTLFLLCPVITGQRISANSADFVSTN
jgi:hypothetical protein